MLWSKVAKVSTQENHIHKFVFINLTNGHLQLEPKERQLNGQLVRKETNRFREIENSDFLYAFLLFKQG
jgi:hypothetical protein